MRPYLPAIVAFLIGLLFIAFPPLAAFLLAGLAFFFAGVYATIVYRIQLIKKQRKAHGGYQYDASTNTWYDSAELSNIEDPSFRNVTTFIFRNGRWVRY